MGFKVLEAINYRLTGLALAGTEYSIHASYEVTKKNNLFTIEGVADVYAGSDHTKKTIDVIHVVLKGLAAVPASHDEVIAALYTELKKNKRFIGKTIVDN